MASTSTNKQPLLVDHVFHKVVTLDAAINSPNASGIPDVSPTNSAELMLDATNTDGAIVEDVYLISRGAIQYEVELFLSTANDYLRPNQGNFIGFAVSGTTIGNVTRMDLPRVLAPVPQVGTVPYNNALYVPKGMALWAARLSSSTVTDGPVLGIQGGWF